MPNRALEFARSAAHAIGLLLLASAWAWAMGALHFVFHMPGIIMWPAILALPISWFAWPLRRRTILLVQALVTILVIAGLAVFLRPSNERDWWEENSIQPTAVIDEPNGTITVKGIRAFKWRTRTDYSPLWVDRSFKLADASSLDLIIEPLGDSAYFAHSMLSFGFGDGSHVVISVEVRREKGEDFGILPGLYGQFDLMYQVLDERDALTLRALAPDSHLYIYPIKATPKFIRGLFIDMLNEANSLSEKPKFYHSLRANCTTKLFDHMNRVIDKPLKYRKEVLFPSMAGELLAEMDWLKTDLPYDEAKNQARSTDRVRRFAKDPDFSAKIRERE